MTSYPNGGIAITRGGAGIFVSDSEETDGIGIWVDESIRQASGLRTMLKDEGASLSPFPEQPSTQLLILSPESISIFDQFCHPGWLLPLQQKRYYRNLAKAQAQALGEEEGDHVEEWTRKVILKAGWVDACLRSGRFLGETDHWGGLRAGGPPLSPRITPVLEVTPQPVPLPNGAELARAPLQRKHEDSEDMRKRKRLQSPTPQPPDHDHGNGGLDLEIGAVIASPKAAATLPPTTEVELEGRGGQSEEIRQTRLEAEAEAVSVSSSPPSSDIILLDDRTRIATPPPSDIIILDDRTRIATPTGDLDHQTQTLDDGLVPHEVITEHQAIPTPEDTNDGIVPLPSASPLVVSLDPPAPGITSEPEPELGLGLVINIKDEPEDRDRIAPLPTRNSKQRLKSEDEEIEVIEVKSVPPKKKKKKDKQQVKSIQSQPPASHGQGSKQQQGRPAVPVPVPPQVSSFEAPTQLRAMTSPSKATSTLKKSEEALIFAGLRVWVDTQYTSRVALITRIKSEGGTVVPDFSLATHVLINRYMKFSDKWEPIIPNLVNSGIWILKLGWAEECFRAGKKVRELEYAVPGGSPILLDDDDL